MFDLENLVNSVEDITFIDISENPDYPAEILVLFNPELYHLTSTNIDDCENYLAIYYNNIANFQKDPNLLAAGLIHITPSYPDDMSTSVRELLAKTVKSTTKDFILAQSVRSPDANN